MTGSGPDARDPQLLSTCVSGWVGGNGYSAELAAASLAAKWDQIVGSQVAAHVTVGEFTPMGRGGELVVIADSQEWALQLQYLIGQIQRRVDEEIGVGVVTTIVIRGPGGRTTGGWKVRTGRRSPRLTPPKPPPDQPPTLDLE
jgi:predicted nucleic acid-binding Zn ribbon protein